MEIKQSKFENLIGFIKEFTSGVVSHLASGQLL